jgi:hypothetical protein
MRCPVCKADNLLMPQCRRCKADLSLLVALEERRNRAMAEAGARLAYGNVVEALAAAKTANGLRTDSDSRKLLAVVRLMSRDFVGAMAGHGRVVGEQDVSLARAGASAEGSVSASPTRS